MFKYSSLALSLNLGILACHPRWYWNAWSKKPSHPHCSFTLIMKSRKAENENDRTKCSLMFKVKKSEKYLFLLLDV
jgi:hypothetical protein